jgi:hypothetical protein
MRLSCSSLGPPARARDQAAARWRGVGRLARVRKDLQLTIDLIVTGEKSRIRLNHLRQASKQVCAVAAPSFGAIEILGFNPISMAWRIMFS